MEASVITGLFCPLYIINDRKKIKELKKILRNKINSKENINWSRDQKLHDLAYEMVNRKIKKEFQSPIYEVVNSKIEKNEENILTWVNPCLEETSDDEKILGYSLLLNRILTWRPKKFLSNWTPLDHELVHILRVKERIIARLLLDYIIKL